MMESGRRDSNVNATRNDIDRKVRHLMNMRDEQLDEELRGQLRKKNEENRKNLNDSSRPDAMDTD